MPSSKYSLSLESLKGLSESDFSQIIGDWVERCSDPVVSAAIDKEVLDQIKLYETQYQLTSPDLKLQAEREEFIDNREISYWLILLDSYPECLTET